MKIIDVSQNEVNGGSVRLAAAHANSTLVSNISPETVWLLQQEKNHDIHSDQCFLDFQRNVEKQKSDLVTLLTELKKAGKTVIGYLSLIHI